MEKAFVHKESVTLIGLFLLTCCLAGGALYSVKMKQAGAKNLPSELTSITSNQLLPHLSNTKGAAKANYILVSFTDYQCPACKKADISIDKYLAENSGNLAYAVVNYPLPYHKQARDMAVYATMNATPGDFWKTHTRLMQSKEAFNWHDCSKDVKPCKDPVLATAKAKVDGDIALGDHIPIKGTPTHLLYSKRSGKLYNIQSFSQIGLSIDRRL
jgi:protein-disulfide isomerase